MHPRTLAIVAVMLTTPTVAHADFNVAQQLQACARVNNCESTIAIAAVISRDQIDGRYFGPHPRACFPQNVADKTLFDGMMDYYKRHPERSYDDFYAVTRDAVAERWPCAPEPPRPPGPKAFEVQGCRGGVCGAVRADGTIEPRP